MWPRSPRVYGLARQSVQRTADSLVRDGLAVYEANPRHRRAKLLRLTPAGSSALDAMEVAQRAWADALGAELGESDLRQAAEVLQRVRRRARDASVRLGASSGRDHATTC